MVFCCVFYIIYLFFSKNRHKIINKILLETYTYCAESVFFEDIRAGIACKLSLCGA